MHKKGTQIQYYLVINNQSEDSEASVCIVYPGALEDCLMFGVMRAESDTIQMIFIYLYAFTLFLFVGR